MKQPVILLTALLLATTILHAQQKEPKFFTELSVGPSFPIGKFANKTYKSLYQDDQQPGFAKTGMNLQAALGYYLKENVGLLFSPAYSIHPRDEKAYASNLKDVYNQLYGSSAPSRVDVDAKSWKLIKLMAGGFLVTPLNTDETLVLVTKVVAGACKTDLPAMSYKVYDQSDQVYATGADDKTSLAWAFCYQVSMGLKYKLNNKLHVLFDINSFNSTPKKEYFFNSDPSSSGPQTSHIIKYRLAEVNALIGVGISF